MLSIGYGREKRQAVVNHLRDLRSALPQYRVIDVGASDNPWTAEVIDAVFDSRPTNVPVALFFQGDANNPYTWDSLLAYVEAHGKFDYAVTSHLLEDISLPQVTLEMLPRIAKAGYICSPSRFLEMQRLEGPWRGYIHHRWILTEVRGELVLVPKIPYIEWVEPTFQYHDDLAEIQIEWEGEIPFKVLNGGYLGPNVQCVKDMYQEALR